MKYLIPVENIETLRKKVTSITKKAVKHGVTITFEELGEVVKEIKDERGIIQPRKYIEVEADGEAKFDGWVFVGTIEHTECGNILRSVSDEHKIPERYKEAEPFCEHCKTHRVRKDTYVVYNEETDEFKQVGKTCLKEYTKGLSVEMAALVLQWDKELEESCFYGGTSFVKVYNVKEISKYFVETMHKFGWASSGSFGGSTKELGMDFYNLDMGNIRFEKEAKEIKAKAEEVNFNIENISDEYIEKALTWAKEWDEHEYNDYRNNLKVIANMKYCEYKHLGYLASLFMAYDKAMEREIKKMEKAKSRANSEYIAEVGERITVEVKSWKCLTSWETQFGTTMLYEFITEDDNVIIWKTGKYVEEVKKLTGTVKGHKEFNGVAQTELTRCKVA